MPLEEDVSSESSAESSDEQVYLDLNGRMSKIQFIFNQYETSKWRQCAHTRQFLLDVNNGQLTLPNLQIL